MNFGPLSTQKLLGLAALRDQAVEHTDDSLGRQRKIDLNGQALAMKLIEHVEQTNRPSGTQHVVHEVHRPTLRGRRRRDFSTAPRGRN